MGGKTACVIGAGLGGLALAIRLQASGVQTTIIEARDKAGGRAYSWQKDGFTFDAGPTIISDPAPLAELWAVSGHDMADDLELLYVDPHFRLNWSDGTAFDLATTREEMLTEIRRINPQDVAGYDAYCAYLRETSAPQTSAPAKQGPSLFSSGLFSSARALIGSAPDWAQNRGWQSPYAAASRYFKSDKLAQAFSFRAMLTGTNPAGGSSAFSSMIAPHTSRMAENSFQAPTFWVRGGMGRLVAAMARHFERLGGKIIFGDPVVRIETESNRAVAVHAQSGWRGSFDCIASNGDPVATYRDLLGRHQQGWKMGKKLAKARYAFSAFIVHFGLEGTWPGIPHHMALFGPRFEGLFSDICEAGVLPEDMLIYLHHPTVTDPSMAPAGKSSFMAMVPVPHTGKMTMDWDLIGPQFEKRILDEIGRRLVPDIYDRITASFHYSPKDFSKDLGAHMGSAFGAAAGLAEGIGSAQNRDPAIAGFYMVGASTQAGSSISGAMASAQNAAEQMLVDLARGQSKA